MAEASCACAVASWAAAAKSHIDQRLHWIGRVLDEFGGEFHVLLGGEVGHQIVELKHESDVVAPVIGQLLRVEVRDVDAVDDDLAFGIRVHAAQDVEQRGLAGAGRPQQHAEFAFFHGQVDAFQHLDPVFTAAKGLFDLIQFKKHRNAPLLVSRL